MKFFYRETSLVTPDTVVETVRSLRPYLAKLREDPGPVLSLPTDKKLLAKVTDLVERKDVKNLGAVVVVGIGGSNLGTGAVYNALKDVANIKRPLWFAETVDPVALQKIINKIAATYRSGQHVELVVASKSGKTLETDANFKVLIEKLKNLDDDWTDRITAITRPGSPLAERARGNGFDSLTIPEDLSGRYSVFSAVGLYPLGLAGVDLLALRAGAARAEDETALTSAAVIFQHYQQLRTIHNSFFFAPQLKTVGRWYRQLVAESLGKNQKGITPITSIGTTDLHSMAQLYFGGPDDKLTTLIRVKDFGVDWETPDGYTITQLMQAIYGGVRETYIKKQLPFVEFELDKVAEESIGEFLQTKMIEVVLLAKLLEVNPFNQPAVESYKEKTRQILRGKTW